MEVITVIKHFLKLLWGIGLVLAVSLTWMFSSALIAQNCGLPENTNSSVMVVPASGKLVMADIGKDADDESKDEDDGSKDEDETAKLIKKGEKIFFEEQFGGKGSTCGTCHRADNNFTIDAAFIATLPDDDPLFVTEFNPDLADLEKPQLMREFGLILENLDGFDKPGVMRGVPHVLALSNSVNSTRDPRTGWSGDGAPSDDPGNGRDGSLRAFSIGAVIQHFPKTLDRVAGTDFRLPTDEELDALEAFMLSLGRQEDLDLPLPLKGAVSKRGQDILLDPLLGKFNFCHANAGANASFFQVLATSTLILGSNHFPTRQLICSPLSLLGLTSHLPMAGLAQGK